MMTLDAFRKEITEGIPTIVPEIQEYDVTINHAPKRKEVLSTDEKKLALKNALRYFPKEQHRILAPEFAQEMKETLNQVNEQLVSSVPSINFADAMAGDNEQKA